MLTPTPSVDAATATAVQMARQAMLPQAPTPMSLKSNAVEWVASGVPMRSLSARSSLIVELDVELTKIQLNAG